MPHSRFFTVFIVSLFTITAFFAVFTHQVFAETAAEKEARLEAELAQVEAEQRETQKVLSEAQSQSASISRDILILNTKIKAAELNIKAKNLLIATLGKDITAKEQTIETLEERIEKGQQTLSQIMRKTNEIDSVTLPEILLSQDTISDAFSNLDEFESVQLALHATFEEIRSAKSQTEVEKDTLDKKKNAESDARYAIQQEQKSIEGNKVESQKLLNISKNKEQTYSQVLAEKEKKAAEIRAALFSLRDVDAIPFEVALKYANEAYKATGIRPAFLLGIFAQESSFDSGDSTFGKQVGSCYLTDTKTGAGASIKSGRIFPNVMKPDRDVSPFLDIVKDLGLDYTKTLVSCPQSIGYGGAMGPAQFIPSTWVLYIKRIQNAIGSIIPNPWNPEHAFVAASLLLIDNGAKYGSYTAEQNAACKYYSGRSCSASSIARSYGTAVMAKADMIQRTMIDPLQGL